MGMTLVVLLLLFCLHIFKSFRENFALVVSVLVSIRDFSVVSIIIFKNNLIEWATFPSY